MVKLPKGWVTTTIGKVCNKPKQRKPEEDELFKYIDIGSIDRQKKRIGELSDTLGKDAPSRARKMVDKGDVLVSMTRPNLNAVAKVDEKLSGQIASTGFDVLKPVLINSDWIFNAVKTNQFIDAVSGITQGALYPACKADDIRGYEIPLPPLEEQTRIAEKLNDLLGQVDTIQTRLDRLPEIIKRFRQSVLAAAVSGQLTEEWRCSHHLVPSEDAGNEKCWSKCKLREITGFQNGYAFKSSWFSDTGEFQIIKLANVKDNKLKLDAAPAFVSKDVGNSHLKFRPQEGDILITMTGTKFKRDYGYVSKVDSNSNILINQRVGRLTPDRNLVNPDFLLIFLRSEVFRDQFFAGETGGVNQGNVGSKHILECEIVTPDLVEQEQIVQRVKQFFALADTLETNLTKARERVAQLTQSILAKAFRGELVPQDEKDEPADQLLARTTAARAEADKLEKAAKKATRTRRTKTASAT